MEEPRESERAIAWGTVDSPFGQIVVAASERGLVRVTMPGEDPDVALDEVVALATGAREEPALVVEAMAQIEAYFAGELREFDLPIDWRLAGKGFGAEVLRATAGIPYGSTRSYGEIAAEAGRPGAQRAAGTALGGNPLAPVVPCHRVILASGKIGNYGGGAAAKRELLSMEGALGPRLVSGSHDERRPPQTDVDDAARAA